MWCVCIGLLLRDIMMKVAIKVILHNRIPVVVPEWRTSGLFVSFSQPSPSHLHPFSVYHLLNYSLSLSLGLFPFFTPTPFPHAYTFKACSRSQCKENRHRASWLHSKKPMRNQVTVRFKNIFWVKIGGKWMENGSRASPPHSLLRLKWQFTLFLWHLFETWNIGRNGWREKAAGEFRDWWDSWRDNDRHILQPPARQHIPTPSPHHH